MSEIRQSRKLFAAMSLALLAGAASPLAAQGRQIFQWSGRVQQETFITVRGSNARVREGRYESSGNLRLNSALPRDDGRLMVRLERGSADVDVVQQPSYRNDYTAVIRVRDNARRNDRIQVAAFWRPEYDGRVGNNRDGDGPWGRIDDRADRRDDRRDMGTRSAFRWSGRVDNEVEIRLQGRSVSYRTLSGAALRDVRLDTQQGLPREEGFVSVTQRNGRGTVTVIEQPTARNNYTAVIRVRDPQGGASTYDFDVMWRDGDRRGW